MKIEWRAQTSLSRILAIIFFIIVLPVWMFFLGKEYEKYLDLITLINTTQALQEEVPRNQWETYVNEKYGYSYEHPKLPVSSSSLSYVFTVESVLPQFLTSKDLQEYAESLWLYNKNDPNPNLQDRGLTPLVETTVSGRPAYAFTLDQGFTSSSGGYVLGERHTYIVTANQQNDIFLINFPTNSSTSTRILSTLKIDSSLIAPKAAAAEWKQYSNENIGISFSYPSNIFTSFNDETNPEFIFGATSKRGGLLVQLMNKPLDPENIDGMYGDIENPDRISVGNRIGYAYGWGDAGCFSRIVDTEGAGNRTLRISFGSCSEDLYYIAEDKALQAEILKTFVFNK